MNIRRFLSLVAMIGEQSQDFHRKQVQNQSLKHSLYSKHKQNVQSLQTVIDQSSYDCSDQMIEHQRAINIRTSKINVKNEELQLFQKNVWSQSLFTTKEIDAFITG